MTEQFITHFQIRLDQLYKEIDAYETESALWVIGEGISNSGGTLALHLVGNLNHFIGHGLGATGYVRDRPAEFNSRNVPKADILQSILATKEMIASSLSGLSPDLYEGVYPLTMPPAFPANMTTSYFLFHLLGHLTYHLGQVNYHRRLLGQ